MSDSEKWLMPHLDAKHIIDRYRRAAGNEYESGKIALPESSAALAANTFGYFLNRPADFPALPGWRGTWKPHSVLPEEELRFPWTGGHHPWLDAVIETDSHILGVESKRYEPYRGGKRAEFSSAYWRDVWGDQMRPCEWLRDGLKERPELFRFVDAAQLIKHAFGLRTQGAIRGRKPVLVYLYAEPQAWADLKPIEEDLRVAHAEEVRVFARLVEGAEVAFMHMTYRALLNAFAASSISGVRDHGLALSARFDC